MSKETYYDKDRAINVNSNLLSKSTASLASSSSCSPEVYLNSLNEFNFNNADSNHNDAYKIFDRKTNLKYVQSTKHISFSVYLLASLFLIQLSLTTIGFYLQFSYLKNQSQLFESRINNVLSEVFNEFSINPNSNREERSFLKNEDVGKSDDDSYMILNLTHPIKLDTTDDLGWNKNFSALKDEFFNSLINNNIKVRLKRSSSSSFKHQKSNMSNFNKNASKSLNKMADAFYILNKQPNKDTNHIPNPADHFLIQAYSKISVILIIK